MTNYAMNKPDRFNPTTNDDIFAAKAAANEKFTTDDVDTIEGLDIIAETYAFDYDGDFEFMVEMRNTVLRRGMLTSGQAKGVLNCMLADWRRAHRSAPNAEVVPAPTPIDRDAILDGTYTVVLPDDTWKTLKIETVPENSWGDNYSGWTFVKLLTGPDNTTSFTNIGFVLPSGEFRLKNAYSSNTQLHQIALGLLTGSKDELHKAGVAYARISGRCYVCGKTLTTPESIEAGIGPICAGRL